MTNYDISPGLRRLRQHPDAERIRQSVLAEQGRSADYIQKETAMTAAAATETKPKPKKADAKPKGRKSKFTDEMKITVLHKGDNPKRGTAAKRYELYKTGMTVAEYKKAVGDPGKAMADLRWDSGKGWIKIA